MSERKKNSRKVTLTLLKTQNSFPHRLPRTQKEHLKNFELLFALQRIAYPELNGPLKMRRDLIKWRKMK